MSRSSSASARCSARSSKSRGGAEVLASRLLNLFGEKRAPLAMGLTGLIFGIPVFFDVGIFVLAPIVYAAAKRSGKSILLYAMPLLAGLSMTHAFLPPHPGPVAAAGLLHVRPRLGHPDGHRLSASPPCSPPGSTPPGSASASSSPSRRTWSRPPTRRRPRVVEEQRAAGVKPREKPVPLGTVLGDHRYAAGADPRGDVLLDRPRPLHRSARSSSSSATPSSP